MENSPNKKKKWIAIVKFLCSVVMLSIAIRAISLGWFTDNQKVASNNVLDSSVGCNYKIVTCGSKGKYDGYYKTVQDDTQVLKESTQKISFYELNSNEKHENDYVVDSDDIIWEMTQDADFQNYSEGEISPGTCGYVDFYIIPTVTGKIEIEFEFDFQAFNSSNGEGNTEKISVSEDENSLYYPTSDDELNNLLKGHILLFTKIGDEIKWISPNEDGSLKFNIELNVTDDYKVLDDKSVDEFRGVKQRIYWVWPSVLGQLFLSDESITRWDGNYQSINDILNKMGAENISSDLVKSNLKKLLENKKYEYFFPKNTNSETKYTIDNVFEDDENFSGTNYKNLRSYWNNADHKIGNQVDFITVKLKTQPIQSTESGE